MHRDGIPFYWGKAKWKALGLRNPRGFSNYYSNNRVRDNLKHLRLDERRLQRLGLDERRSHFRVERHVRQARIAPEARVEAPAGATAPGPAAARGRRRADKAASKQSAAASWLVQATKSPWARSSQSASFSISFHFARSGGHAVAARTDVRLAFAVTVCENQRSGRHYAAIKVKPAT